MIEHLSELIAPDVTVELVATGFVFTEGTVWTADDALLFNDVPGDVRYRWSPSKGAEVVRQPNAKGNGMVLDRDGNLLICEQTTSRVVRERPDGRIEVVASHYRGKELNSPNDLIVASDGSVVFTDPTFGRTIAAAGLVRPVEQPARGVYRVPPGGGEPILLVEDFDQPNGLCLSPDERRLYVNDTLRAHIRLFDVGPDWRLGNSRIFADKIGTGVLGKGGLVDGMKVDEYGDVFVTGPGGLWVFNADGRRLGVIETPERTANFCWGGADGRTLYIAGATSIYRVATRVRAGADRTR